jgi:hypothetical protein
MAESRGKEIGSFKLEIAPEVLQHIISEGRLMELVATIADEAHAHISSQIVEQIAQAAIDPPRLQAGVSVNVGYIFDGGDFGTVPPIPGWGVGPLRRMQFQGMLSRLAAAREAGDVKA